MVVGVENIEKGKNDGYSTATSYVIIALCMVLLLGEEFYS